MTALPYSEWLRLTEESDASKFALNSARLILDEHAAEHPAVHRRHQVRRNQARRRANKCVGTTKPRTISIEVSGEIYEHLVKLKAAAWDGENFWFKALVTGAKFRVNMCAGKVKPGATPKC